MLFHVISQAANCAFVPPYRGVKVNKSRMTFTHVSRACVCIHANVPRALDAPVDHEAIDRSIAVNSFNSCRAGTSIVRSILSYFVRWIPNRGERNCRNIDWRGGPVPILSEHFQDM